MSKRDRPKIWGQLPHEMYAYFFYKIFAGHRGVKQRLIIQFFEALFNECQRQHIKAEWDPDSHKVIASIMDNLNFREHRSRRAPHQTVKHEA
jgi:hypothetical protein